MPFDKTNAQSTDDASAANQLSDASKPGSMSAKPACERLIADQLVLDFEPPGLSLVRALDSMDEQAIWRLCRESPDQAGSFDALADLASCYSAQQPHPRDDARSVWWRYGLIALPYLLPPHGWAAALPQENDRCAASGIYKELQDWVGHSGRVTIIDRPIDYAGLCRWSPTGQRMNLRNLAREPSTCVAALADELRVPDHFPRLSFLVGTLRGFIAFAQLPKAGADAARDWKLRSRLAAQLSYVEQRPLQPADVLLPADFPDAVLAGLTMWIADLARRQLVRGWELQLSRDGLVLLQLTPADAEGRAAIVPIRQHQIGSTRLGALTACLHEHFGPTSQRTFDA